MMNTNVCFRPLPALGALLLLCAASSAHGQANLSFAGGNGAPLTITLAQPVTYAITTSPTNASPLFIFDALGNFFSSAPSLTGTISFTINGGSPLSFTNVASGVAGGVITADDAILYGNSVASLPGVVPGDVLTLGAGTLSTTGSFAGAAPVSGSFATFIADNSGIQLSTLGVAAVPEPGSVTLAALGILGLVGTLARRHRRQQLPAHV